MQSQACCVDCRIGIPLWNTDYENPCVGNLLGTTFCFNCNWMILFCQSIFILREYAEAEDEDDVSVVVSLDGILVESQEDEVH